MGSTKLGGRGDVHPIKGVQSCIFYVCVCVCVVWLDKLRSRGANSTCVGIDISFRLIRALHSQKKKGSPLPSLSFKMSMKRMSKQIGQLNWQIGVFAHLFFLFVSVELWRTLKEFERTWAVKQKYRETTTSTQTSISATWWIACSFSLE